MCELGSDSPNLQAAQAHYADKRASEPTLRDRLEEKRARLMTQLYQLEDALRLLSTDPNAEKNYEILRRARP